MVPREPTRYAATIVFPCPGDSACNAPSPSAASMQTRIIPKPSSRCASTRDRKSPFTTVPEPAVPPLQERAWHPASPPEPAAPPARSFSGTALVVTGPRAVCHSTFARKSCGGASLGIGRILRQRLASIRVSLARGKNRRAIARIDHDFFPTRALRKIAILKLQSVPVHVVQPERRLNARHRQAARAVADLDRRMRQHRRHQLALRPEFEPLDPLRGLFTRLLIQLRLRTLRIQLPLFQ